jgi:nucleoside-diphosphate-sugar epimerase
LKVLLTGASGFIGSRILARLVLEGIPAAALLRSTSSKDLIRTEAGRVDIRVGALNDRSSLAGALEGVSHVIHCAGKTKALRISEFEEVNVQGTRNLVEAIGTLGGQIQRLVHLSSLAACGPAVAEAPAREVDPPQPVSAYGRSKLKAERVITESEQTDAVILRPGGVYGPGDSDFFQLFRAVQRGWCPVFAGGQQVLNLVYAEDLAQVAIRCLSAGSVRAGVYHVAHPRVIHALELTEQVAGVMQRRPRLVHLPAALLVPLSWGAELMGRLTGKPGILGIDRRKELMASGWVCDTTRLREEAGLACTTDLEPGLRSTLDWYRKAGWISLVGNPG